MTEEGSIKHKILRDLGRETELKIFNNPVGSGWVGVFEGLQSGRVTLANARPVHFGLVVGSGDLIACRSIVITADMVGKRIGVFASLEVKTKTGRARKGQRAWRDTIRKLGGIAEIVRSPEEAREKLGLKPQPKRRK